MGRILIKLVENKTKKIQVVTSGIFGDVAKLTEKLSWDFYALGLKVRQSDFWSMELKTLEDYLAHLKVTGEVTEEDDALFIVALIEKYKK